MKRFLTIAGLCLVALGVLAGAASAAEINCSHTGLACNGTNEGDNIYGWSNSNEIAAKEGRDHVWGYAGFDWLYGRGDGDSLNGGESQDYVYGEYGNDSYFELGGNFGIYGESTADVLYGNEGRDLVEGDQGHDNMMGGDSADILFAEDGEPDNVDGGAEEAGWEQPCYVDGYDSFVACTPY